MSIWSSYPFARIAICFATGILCAPLFPPDLLIYCLLGTMLLFYVIRLFNYRKHSQLTAVILGLLLMIFFLLAGSYRANRDDPTHQRTNLLNQNLDSLQMIALRIDGFPAEKEKYHTYEATAITGYFSGSDSTDTVEDELSSQPVSGKALIYVKKDSLPTTIRYGDVIVTSKAPYSIQPPKNPHQFNYRSFMLRKGISHQVYVTSNDFTVLKAQPRYTIVQYAHQVRRLFQSVINEHIEEKTSRDIASALLLGIKDGLDKDLKSAYSAAGAMHVLAVSGLHVGIIHMILLWVLGFLKRYKYGRISLIICSLLLLWSYAFITGFSPSVLRAVTMFSIILIGQQTVRNHNVYNSLAVSAFIILLYQPMMIREVGFQLSYVAVLGIVSIQPGLYALYKPKNIILDKAWAITCVSLSAQLATLPISLYYFHQFPSYFLFANLLVIPAAFLILCTGLAMMAASLLSEWMAHALGLLLDGLIQFLNMGIFLIKKLPYHLLDRIWIDLPQVILLYLVIWLITRLLILKNAASLRASYVCCILFLVFSLHQSQHQRDQTKLVFYEIRDNLAIDFIDQGTVSTYLSQSPTTVNLINTQVGPNRLANALPEFDEHQLIYHETLDGLGDLIFWKGQRIMILNGNLRHYETDQILTTDVLVLSGNQYVVPDQLKRVLKWKTLLIDGTYQRYKARSLSNVLTQNHIQHANLQQDGALTVTLEN